MNRTVKVLTAFSVFFAAFLLEEAIRRIPGHRFFIPKGWRARNPQRLRDFVESQGGSFIKFGQFFSMRSDILPPAYCAALGDMFDHVPPFPAAEARQIIAEELGAPVDVLFASFDDVAVGSASFGQAHRVTLREPHAGQQAVVKVARPGAAERIATDTRLLLLLGMVVDASSVLGKIKLGPVFRDFVRWIKRELQYMQEAKNADHIHEVTSWNVRQRIPFVYWDLTTSRVLTMEFFEGIAATRLIERFEAGDPTLDDDLAALGCDRLVLARNLLQSFILQCFVGHVFHGDPHPGNIIFLADNTVGFVDFGLLGRLNEEARREQMLTLECVVQENIERLFTAVLDLLDAPRGLTVTGIYDDFYEETDEWLDACDNPGARMSEKSIARLVQSAMLIARKSGLVLPAQTMLYFKALLTIDSVVLRIAPEFDYKRETARASRLVRMRELEKLYQPGSVIDRALAIQLLGNMAPDFLVQRLQDFEQGKKSIFRKMNLIPIILASFFKMSALAFGLAGIGLLAVRIGLLENLPFMQFSLVQLFFDFVAPVIYVVPVIIVGLVWAARVAEARAFVKVQREE